MRIALASDHAGFALKEHLKGWLQRDHDVTDFGTHSAQACDFPDFVHPAAVALGEHTVDRAILVDGAGYPSAIVANKVHGVYAAVCQDPVCARLAREHSDTNALCLGGKLIGEALADEVVRVWLATEALGGKYAQRVEKVRELEGRHLLARWQRPREILTVEDLRRALLDREGLVIGPDTRVTPAVRDLVNRL
jgi:ribose 5-phosphate isomerase B